MTINTDEKLTRRFTIRIARARYESEREESRTLERLDAAGKIPPDNLATYFPPSSMLRRSPIELTRDCTPLNA